MFQICDQYEASFCNRKHPHYLYVVWDEVFDMLHNGGLWAYSNDIHETMQCLAKEIYLRFSNRGGACGQHPTETIIQHLFMRVHVCTFPGGPGKIIGLKHEIKQAEKFVRLLGDDVPVSTD